MSRFYFEEHEFSVRLKGDETCKVKVLGNEGDFFRCRLLGGTLVRLIPKTSILWMDILEDESEKSPDQPIKTQRRTTARSRDA